MRYTSPGCRAPLTGWFCEVTYRISENTITVNSPNQRSSWDTVSRGNCCFENRRWVLLLIRTRTNSESRRGRAGNCTFSAPFTVLTKLGLRRLRHDRLQPIRAPLAAVYVGRVFCRKMKTPCRQPIGPFLFDPNVFRSGEPFGSRIRSPLIE